MGFSRQECWSGLSFPSPGDLPDPGIEPGSPTLYADDLPSEPRGKSFHSSNSSFIFGSQMVWHPRLHFLPMPRLLLSDSLILLLGRGPHPGSGPVLHQHQHRCPSALCPHRSGVLCFIPGRHPHRPQGWCWSRWAVTASPHVYLWHLVSPALRGWGLRIPHGLPPVRTGEIESKAAA